ncbi:MAG: fibronectin type III domain-containing protein [Bacteroidales bacterium]|nr:fibronectin type III domain-containing protein [Bacteroidales bacterium]
MKTNDLKKRMALLMLGLAMLLSWGAVAQTPITTVVAIGDTTNMFLSTGNFRLPCMYLPSSYTQQLIQKDELNGAAMITGIDLYCGTPSSTGCPGCTIYLANTYVSNMGGGLVGFGPMFQMVAVDSLVCTTGWNHYDFDTAFYYNGLGNLIIAVDCPSGWSGGNFYLAQRGVLESRYTNTRLAGITPTTTSTANPSRNIMRLHTQSVPLPVATCPAPTVWVDSLGATAVKVRWSPGFQDTLWRVDCITDGDTAWRTSGLVWGDTTYTMAGLAPNCNYTFRLTAYCADTFTTVLKRVLTNCMPAALPYAENFESTWSLPGCWHATPGTAGDRPAVNSSYHHTGTHSLKMNGGAVVLPVFDAAPDSLELYFWVTKNTSSASLYVGMVSDPLDLSTFYPLDTVVVPRTTSWEPVSVRTSSYPRSSGRLAIVSSSPNNPWSYIDDIEVSHIVPCEALGQAMVDWVADTAALVRWVDTVGAVYYDVAYGPAGFTPDSSNMVTNVRTDSLLLTGLLPYTQYDVYVRPECGSFTTHWSPMLRFRTFCSLIDTLPYVENFDNCADYIALTAVPCWRGRAGQIVRPSGTSSAHSGLQVARCNWSTYEPSSLTQLAVLPGINTALHPMHTLQLTFWARNNFYYNPQDNARLEVGVMSDPEVDSTFQVVDTVLIATDEWHRYDIPFAAFSGSGSYMALRPISSVSGDGWCTLIDDVVVDIAPPCANVTGIAVWGLTSTSVTVGWDAADSGTRWVTYIDTIAAATPVAGSVSVASPSYTFGGLVAEQPYYVWVAAICPKGDTSGWEGPMQVVPGGWNMRANRHDTLTMCGVNLYDDGGPNGNFTARQTSTLVVQPDMPGHLVSISGYSHCGGSTMLTVYDGVGTSAPVLWTSGYNSYFPITFGPVVSTMGPLTVYINNAMLAYEGFELQVSCVPDTCIIHNLRPDPAVPVSDTAIALTWDCNGATLYEVEYGPVGFALGTGTLDSSTTNHFTIGGLVSLDRREVYVRSICGEGDTGEWVSGIFATQPCGNAVFRANYDTVSMWANTTPVGPIGPNNSPYNYTQTIVDSAHLAGLEGGITALAFRPESLIKGNHQNHITVYLANVPDTAFADHPIIPDAGHHFVRVIDSANFNHDATNEWQMISFDRAFMWDGHQNLLVAVVREDGGSGERVEYAGHYRYADVTNTVYRSYVMYGDSRFDIDSVLSYTYPTYMSYGHYIVGDLRLYTNTCVLPLCVPPVVDSVVADYESATVVWSGTGERYQVSFTGMGLVDVVGNSYTLTGLQPSTTYSLALRQNCNADSLGYSDWVTVAFTTDSFTCPPPDSLWVFDISHNSATFDWDAEQEETQWQLELWTPGSRHVSYLLTERPFVVEELLPGTEYCAYIRRYCGSEHQIAGEWSDRVCFSTAACPKTTGLDTSSVTTTTVSLIWRALPIAEGYILEYGTAGFALGTGTEQAVSSNSTTVTGLIPATAYDFYVRTRCAEDWLAEEYAALLNIVTHSELGIAEESSQMRFALKPNPAKGVTTVHIVGLPDRMAGTLRVTVADLTGRNVIERDIECDGQCRTSLDIYGLPAGAYFVRLVGEWGTAVRKLIIKN